MLGFGNNLDIEYNSIDSDLPNEDWKLLLKNEKDKLETKDINDKQIYLRHIMLIS